MNKNQKILIDNKAAIPAHIAIIPDGNRRWAVKKGLPRSMGYKFGVDAFKKITDFCLLIGVKYISFYTFSTENWARPKNEVDALMKLLEDYLDDAIKKKNKSLRLMTVGREEGLPLAVVRKVEKVKSLTEGNTGLNVILALNYGGRDEIVSVAREVAREVKEGGLEIDAIDEKLLAGRLYTAGIPEPDLLIRTSGERRASNFYLWQMAYTEYHFADVLWPDFTEKDMVGAILDYSGRDRRFGGV